MQARVRPLDDRGIGELQVAAVERIVRQAGAGPVLDDPAPREAPAAVLRQAERQGRARNPPDRLDAAGRVGPVIVLAELVVERSPALRELGGGDRERFRLALADAIHADPDAPDVDLLIRTGGESRLSDLLGWDSAYAELLFHRQMWPEFEASDLRAAVEVFRARERRFGGLTNTDLAPEPATTAANGASRIAIPVY